MNVPPDDLFCLLGPSIGFNREVLMFAIGEPESPSRWGLPWRGLVQQLLHMLELPEIAPKELHDFGQRAAGPATDAKMLHLRVAILSLKRFADLEARMRTREITLFRAFLYKDVVSKVSNTDWVSYAALTYVFYHLDR